MKQWIVAALVLALGLMLAGCAGGKVDAGRIAAAETDNNQYFMVVSYELNGMVMVDKETGVMYWASRSSHNSGHLNLLVNADGTPRIWKK